MKIRQKIDKAASDQLERILSAFPASWGKERTSTGHASYLLEDFPAGGDVTVAYDAKKQLLGGVFSLVFSLTSKGILWSEDCKADLKYKGSFIKGAAYFSAKKSENALSVLLNDQNSLIQLLSDLDLMNMTVAVNSGTLEVRLSPLGGAYTYTVFPPMKYGAILPDGDLERIRKVLVTIADLFSEDGIQAAAGAE